MPRLLAAIVALAALAACGEEESSSAAPAGVDLTVRVSDGEGRTAMGTLDCADGTARATGFLRPAAARRCAFARRHAGFLAAQPDRDRICTEVYGGPDTARVRGRIGGRRVDRRFARSDGCAIADWDRAAPLFAGGPRSALARGAGP